MTQYIIKTADISGEWESELWFIDNSADGIVHLESHVIGKSKEGALAGAQWAMDMFGKGRECFIRCAPEADTSHDFNTKTDHHRGYVRFSFATESTNWQTPDTTFKGFVGLSEAKQS